MSLERKTWSSTNRNEVWAKVIEIKIDQSHWCHMAELDHAGGPSDWFFLLIE